MSIQKTKRICIERIDNTKLKMYNVFRKQEEVNTMARKKKNGNKDKTLQILVLVTAILNLVQSLIDLISKLTE